jgi:microcystin degradation protein MlrC
MLSRSAKAKAYRVAIVGIYHETNTFVQTPTTINDFKKGRWMTGDSILNEYENAYHELGGAIEIFRLNNVTLLPVFYAETTPGGMITEEAYEQLVSEVLGGLEKVTPVDGCLVVPHGAAVAINHPDMDGDWLEQVRKKLGNDIPIVGTLDPHANVSQKMVDLTQGLFPYRTNPHIDQRETGARAAQFLLSILKGETKPLHQLYQAPVAISIEKQHTGSEPCECLFRLAQSLCEGRKNFFVEIILGFPYADVYEMGTSIILIADINMHQVSYVQSKLQTYVLDHLTEYSSKSEGIDETLKKLDNLRKPVLLLDMGDNVGGGTSGDSTFLLEKLDATGYSCFISVFDPLAVELCFTHKPGQKFELSFGRDPESGSRYNSQVTLMGIYPGKFQEQRPRHGGQLNYDMGTAAVLRTASGKTVLLHSKRMPPFSLAQLTSCNIDPTEFDVIIAKGVNAPIAAYGEVCPTRLQAYTPGPSQADMTQFHYKKRRKPLYPFEDPRLC